MTRFQLRVRGSSTAWVRYSGQAVHWVPTSLAPLTSPPFGLCRGSADGSGRSREAGPPRGSALILGRTGGYPSTWSRAWAPSLLTAHKGMQVPPSKVAAAYVCPSDAKPSLPRLPRLSSLLRTYPSIWGWEGWGCDRWPGTGAREPIGSPLISSIMLHDSLSLLSPVQCVGWWWVC